VIGVQEDLDGDVLRKRLWLANEQARQTNPTSALRKTIARLHLIGLV